MPKAEAGTPKAIAKAIKAKGLGKLKWYCQVCEKQMRDDNGFKLHMQAESHLRKMITVGEQAGRHINNYSEEFKSGFLRILSRQYGTRRVRANSVYQEYIQDKQHVHMNSTRWISLTSFVNYLGRAGIVRVDEVDGKLFIAWVDNSPQALARTEAAQKKERHHMDDEERERKLINEQIARAKQTASSEEQALVERDKEKGLQRDAGPIKLTWGGPPSAVHPAATTPNPGPGPSLSPMASTVQVVLPAAAKPKNVFKSNNAFKAAKRPAEAAVTDEEDRKRSRVSH